jgi:hypothetical protein
MARFVELNSRLRGIFVQEMIEMELEIFCDIRRVRQIEGLSAYDLPL